MSFIEVVRYLIKIHTVREQIDRRDSDSRTALYYAQCGVMARMLIDAGANAEALDKFGKTPLMVMSADAREQVHPPPAYKKW